MNAVWRGYDDMIEDGVFTWPNPFWDQPLWRWDAMFAAGVRAHYRASQIAARSMVPQRRGLIVNLSHWAAQKRIGNVAYGVAKAATDKMTADMAEELRAHGVTAVSLYPGLVRTEKDHARTRHRTHHAEGGDDLRRDERSAGSPGIPEVDDDRERRAGEAQLRQNHCRHLRPALEPQKYQGGAPRLYQLFSHSDQVAQWQTSSGPALHTTATFCCAQSVCSSTRLG